MRDDNLILFIFESNERDQLKNTGISSMLFSFFHRANEFRYLLFRFAIIIIISFAGQNEVWAKFFLW